MPVKGIVYPAGVWQRVEEQRFLEGTLMRPCGDNEGYAKNGRLWKIPIWA